MAIQTQTKKLMLILNPVAGRAEAKKKLADIISLFSLGGYTVTVFVTGNQGEAAQLAERYAGEHDIVVCSGGDGTVNEVVAGIIAGEHDTPIGYIPAGSYNDFADYHGLSKDVLKAAQSIITGEEHPVDVIRFNRRCFINAADFGAFTWLPYTTSQELKNIFGSFAYILDGIKDLSKIKSTHMRMIANGGVFEGDYIFGVVCNATMLGGVMSGKGRLVRSDDGIFEVGMVREPKTPLDFQETLQALYNEDLSSPHLTFFKAGSMVIETEQPVDWSLDGELERADTRVQVEILRSRIRLIF